MNDLSSHHNDAAGIPAKAENTEREKLAGLSRGEERSSADVHRYTKLIKSLKIILPLIALCIVAVIWHHSAAGFFETPINLRGFLGVDSASGS